MEGKPVRQKSHRLPREVYIGHVTVAFTLCVLEKQPLFEDSEVVEMLIEIMRKSTSKHKTQVIVYCFMPDHLRLILQGLTVKADLWKAIVDFKQRSGYWLRQNRKQCYWQKGFYDHVIRKSEDLGSQLRYILENPVRKKLVQQWKEYPYTGSLSTEIEVLMNGISDK